ncbi:hypothetical protein HUO14_11655 [Parasphingorhabdus flavimaris]|uniref:Uncharacterized protein n=1 Tax=Parasphingorhabdus flavimaris TaxID=266812 RepID=A0ABX2N4N3_9SPHN|nr:hypothetical protein [Parasphingorhabdus flavimaris]NVD28558.1 hypothetical protein [Parasphingorhabdus flavimaris]|tara:strand:- start:4759 stop:5085 length:327 start_codon:yes stop_codon:yes gene_type:complete
MKNSIATLTVFASAFALSACGTSNETSETAATEETAEAVSTEECTQDAMMAKATKLGEKMQGLASDPEAMQKMTSKMQEVQEKMQKGAADGSFGIVEACAVYDEMLAE